MVQQESKAHIVDTPVAQTNATLSQLIQQCTTMTERTNLVRAFKTVVALAQQVVDTCGRLFIVGGAVRDELLGRQPQDFDVEIHGVSLVDVEKLLSSFGPVALTGKSFGTYKISAGTSTVEVALPRRDTHFGDAHTAVTVSIDPFLGLTAAARRREFTISAIYKDPLTGAIYDPFGGIGDLASGILRHVDDTSFADDALRVLRGAVHAARFHLRVDESTAILMRGMVEKMGALSKERLLKEWTKLLLQADRPSIGLEVLRTVGVLERWYPELSILWATAQDPRHHPEGSVGQHTKMVIDCAAKMMREVGFVPAEQFVFMFAALLHDTGKPATSEQFNDRVESHHYEVASMQPTSQFLQRLGVPTTIAQRVLSLVLHQARPANLYQQRDSVSDRALRQLAHDIGPSHLRTLIALAEVDHLGRGPFPTTDGVAAPADTTQYHRWWSAQIQRLCLDKAPEQLLWGHDLVARGWRPGPMIGEAVRLAEQLAIAGSTREQILAAVSDAENPDQALARLRTLLESA